MNPFRTFTKLRLTLRRWRVARTHTIIPVERPPRSQRPRGRLQVLWITDLAGPFPVEVESPPSTWERF